ncbi:Metallo-dependent phosphatase [Aureobasidium subglaciale]|nr:Metallo-dependent phosphatase [Aureobasidium subglaciale]
MKTIKRILKSSSLTKQPVPSKMPPSGTVKTRILIISDTHSTPLETPSASQPFRHPLPSADVLIHCGDLTMEGLTSEYKKTLDMLAAIDAPVKLVIAGNHDRTLDKEWMRTHEKMLWGKKWKETYEEAREIWFGKNGRARKEGVTMLEEGVHEIDVGNGAVLTLYASPYQPEFYDWAFPYEKHQDRYNTPFNTLSDAENIAVNPIPSFSEKAIDVICTHGPPWKHGDITAHGNVGCPHLLTAVSRAKPLIHCFGHIHEGWGAETVTWDKATEFSETETIAQFKAEGWKKHIKGTEDVEVAEKEVKNKRAVFVDGTNEGSKEIRRGEQTLMVNAAIMDVGYDPVNAAFIVDLDLPVKG